MTQAAKKLLEEFDALQEGDRAEVLAELLRRVALAPHDLPDPDDLVSAADQIFLELDRRRAVAVKAPQRGEVWLVDLGLAAKVRPAVVMSIPAADVDRALVTVVPHTTSARGSRFEAAVSVPFLRAGVFDAQNLVTIPHAKLIRDLGKLLPAQMVVVERATAAWLGLSLAASTNE